MRVIRNHCRRWMTRDQRVISPVRQQFWWNNRANSVQAYLYYVGETPVGFGLLRCDDEKLWATLGLLRAWRGQGIGTWIYQDLIARSPDALWIEVRPENARSLRAAEKAGFVLAEASGELRLLVARKK